MGKEEFTYLKPNGRGLYLRERVMLTASTIINFFFQTLHCLKLHLFRQVHKSLNFRTLTTLLRDPSWLLVYLPRNFLREKKLYSLYCKFFCVLRCASPISPLVSDIERTYKYINMRHDLLSYMKMQGRHGFFFRIRLYYILIL